MEAQPEGVEPGQRVLGEHLDDDAALGRRRQRAQEGRQVDDVVQHVVAHHEIGASGVVGDLRPGTEHGATRDVAGRGRRREPVEHVPLPVDPDDRRDPVEREGRPPATASHVQHRAPVTEQLRGRCP